MISNINLPLHLYTCDFTLVFMSMKLSSKIYKKTKKQKYEFSHWKRPQIKKCHGEKSFYLSLECHYRKCSIKDW